MSIHQHGLEQVFLRRHKHRLLPSVPHHHLNLGLSLLLLLRRQLRSQAFPLHPKLARLQNPPSTTPLCTSRLRMQLLKFSHIRNKCPYPHQQPRMLDSHQDPQHLRTQPRHSRRRRTCTRQRRHNNSLHPHVPSRLRTTKQNDGAWSTHQGMCRIRVLWI